MTFLKKIRYFLEGILLYVLYGFFKLLPPETASNIGGRIAKFIGPKLGSSRKAMKNLKKVFPDKGEEEHKNILSDMWDNLGRVFAEYPHIEYISKNLVEIEGQEHLKEIEKNPTIFFSAHMANWEILAPSLLLQLHIEGLLVYRTPNNPYAAKLVENARQIDPRLGFTTKSEKGVRDMVKELRQKGVLGLLIDQKYNKGLDVPFFNHSAMTSPAFVELGQKFKADLFPLQIKRVNGTRFKMTIYPQMQIENHSVEDILHEAHGHLEKWISEEPSQWLWLHQRWKEVE